MAGRIERDPLAASQASYDLIVVGGGIYGAMLALESARRGLRPLLVERDDFGGATSWNSHRIVHGGLRYLQRLDLGRFRVSVRERAWLLRHFPDLVEPLPCLMPLYGRGARRAWVLRLALLANDWLSRGRNQSVRSDRRLDSGGVLTAPETVALFASVPTEGLQGGALWYDAVMSDSQRLLIEVLLWAASAGARCLNYVEATELQREGSTVAGIAAVDRESGDRLAFRAPKVINCAGPWCREVAGAFDRDVEALFRPSLAFNLLFDRRHPSEMALALSRRDPAAHTWFLYPRRGRLYAGTAHYPCSSAPTDPRPTDRQIEETIADINAAAPGLDLRRDQLVRAYSGLLPAAEASSTRLATAPLIFEHGDRGGPAGLTSVSGVKYTTARDVAEQTLRRLFGTSLPDIRQDAGRPAMARTPAISSGDATAPGLRDLVESESVVHLDDLVLRRTTWGEDPAGARGAAATACDLLGWHGERRAAELARLEAGLGG